MKEKKYAQILATVTAFKTSLGFNNEQLKTFAVKSASYCAETMRRVEHDSLSLSELEKIKANFSKDFEKPLLDYQKQLNKIRKEINEKILPCLNQQSANCLLNLQAIRELLEQIKPLISSMQQQLDLCFAELGLCQDKISKLDKHLQRLDLPNLIAKLRTQLEELVLTHGWEALAPLEECIANFKPRPASPKLS